MKRMAEITYLKGAVAGNPETFAVLKVFMPRFWLVSDTPHMRPELRIRLAQKGQSVRHSGCLKCF